MSFRLTYATMFDPPEAMHDRFESALASVTTTLGRQHDLFLGGADVATVDLAPRPSPDRRRADTRTLRSCGPRARRPRNVGGQGCVPGLAGNARCRASEAGASCRRDHGAAGLRDRRSACARGRQEPHGGAGRGPGNGRLLQSLRGRLRWSRWLRSRVAERSARGRSVAKPQRHAPVRRVGRDRPVQLSARAGRRPGRGGAGDG